MFVPSVVQVGLTEGERNALEASSLDDLLDMIRQEGKVSYPRAWSHCSWQRADSQQHLCYVLSASQSIVSAGEREVLSFISIEQCYRVADETATCRVILRGSPPAQPNQPHLARVTGEIFKGVWLPRRHVESCDLIMKASCNGHPSSVRAALHSLASDCPADGSMFQIN